MGVDVIVLNTGVVDFRREDFEFADPLVGEVVDLVGAGDPFRARLITYIGHKLEEFRSSPLDFAEAVQMGNLFAALYIKAPLDNRQCNIRSYDRMLKVVRTGVVYPSLDALRGALA
ncbi:MAG: hypothetical protein ACYS4W_03075 [Planctomycetota bacterium]